ncbi:MAG: bifunctional (p)ppGpp synthetase/guanosine-3',5'-bis(diphosphate) 3'-pyrophosphohydrolase, partial [Treponema sp.]|nr:bifunctional (p)ppGpp synthetase/guanosine-3',5'-bis(diphosphate) 3'-pyrophosphohydrolase [Treponema sp.]
MTETFFTNTTETDPEVLIDTFFKSFPDQYEGEEGEEIREAWDYLISKTGSLKRKCGLPYYLHPMRVACVLAKSRLDTETVMAGFLHNILDVDHDCLGEIAQKFGKSVADICQGTAKITSLKIKSKTMQEADSIRKMLFAMIDDIRIIFVKLADRLDRMRNLRMVEPDAQREVAREVLDVWAPLAGRLGMNDVKNEMEDLSLKYSNPDAFQQIKSLVSQKKDERDIYLQNAVKKIYTAAEKAGLSVSISSRAKHFYSIYQKMRRRNKEAGELYDLLALRVICQTASECYTIVGIVHGLWKPMDGRFKDYIAMPKSNGYQSLHTTVICEGKPLEIQIRTQEMHNVAEHGVASHWLYKKGSSHELVKASDLGIINQLMELRNEQGDGGQSGANDEDFFEKLRDELLGDSIYVFTPKGDVKELPAGSNAIDFAYAIHSAIGEKIIGAKADGKIVPLTAPLQNTQIVEVLTSPQAHPTQSQLKAVKTGKAHQKIHSWLAANDPTFIDREAEAKKQAETAANAEYSRRMAQKHSLQKQQDGKKKSKKDAGGESYTGRIKIDNTTNFFVTIAKCCSPEPGEPISGYVSRGRGITVHRADCLTFLRIPDLERRRVAVECDTRPADKNPDEKE